MLGSTTLYFDQLWFSMVVFVAKGSFLEEGNYTYLHLSMAMRANI